MTATFADHVTPRALGPHAFEITVPDRWQQGRGAYGGLVLAALVRAIETEVERDGRSLRSLNGEIFAPVMPGMARIDVRPLRLGGNVSTLAATLAQNASACAHAVAVYGRARSDTSVVAPPTPSSTPWREIPPAPITEPLAPRFAINLEYRATGSVPFMGAAEPTSEGWIRFLHPGAARDGAYLVALADAWWPSALVCESGPRLMVTIGFSLQIVGSLEGLDPEAPLFFRGRSVSRRDGYIVDFRELWGEDGRLLVLNQQTIAVVQ